MLTRHSFTIAAFVLLAACGRSEPDPAPAGPAGEAAAVEEPAATEAAPATPARTPSPPGAAVFFITPQDGDSVTSPFTVEFGLRGMSVAKAGVEQADSGHHHLLIDAELVDPDQPIPATEHYRHFGDGSTSAELDLPAGEHTLQLVLGDHLHVPHDPPVVSEPITITVQ